MAQASPVHAGFTFIELMMTLAIMAILVLMAVPTAAIAVRQSNERDLRRALIEIREALDAYKRLADQGRIEVKAGDSGYPRSLVDLVNGVTDLKSPQRQPIYLLRRLPRDPFHPDPQTPAEDTWALRSYASPPEAPEPGADVFDVYSRTEGVGLNGIPYRQW
jgi:general secretion pathway protein G